MTSDLSGRVALVTGGTRGIGRGIATSLLAAGAKVVVCGREAPDDLATRPDGTPAHFIAGDVRDDDDVARIIAETIAHAGRLDILVNNAGGSPHRDAITASPRYSRAIIDLNLTSALVLATAAAQVMAAQDGGGSIVNIASISGTRPSPGTAAYGAAKAGLINVTQSLAMEWAPAIRVNAVTPGLVHTEASEGHYGGDTGLARVTATVPMGRMAVPADVGAACVWLASDEAAYVTGANIVLHGGGEWPPFLAAAAGPTP